MTNKLIPNYVDADFATMKARLRDLLSRTDTFKDYNFEGANISVLMELCAYVGDLNTYFTNKLAQNIHTETANVYEVVHSLVRQQGYEPTGYIASELTLTVTVTREDINGVPFFEQGDQLQIPQWFTISTGKTTDSGEAIYYCLTDTFTYNVTDDDVSNGSVSFDVVFKQGVPFDPLVYTGDDIVSNQIVLPFKKFDMGNYPYDEFTPSIVVIVGDTNEVWVRTSDFYDEISGLREVDKAYMFSYDKYGRYILVFSLTREIPSTDQPITVYLIETLGLDGAIASKTFDTENGVGVKPLSDAITGNGWFITNITTGTNINQSQYNLVNNTPSSGGSNPQSINELKEAGKASAHSQYRNVTRKDYIGNLEKRADITKANVWGEQEQNPGVLMPTNYNKAYISLIPTEWDYIELANEATNVYLESVEVSGEFVSNRIQSEGPPIVYYTLDFPTDYNPNWTTQILEYLEPRKMLGIWEEFVLPELVYFRVDFGLKVKRAYNWVDVKESIKRKLEYYFLSENRSFGEVIDFREIYNYIIDPANISPTDDFAMVKGIYSLVVRDVMVYRNVNDPTQIYDENIVNNFPYYINTGYEQDNGDGYNVLTPIQLGYTQFPRLASEFCIFINEG